MQRSYLSIFLRCKYTNIYYYDKILWIFDVAKVLGCSNTRKALHDHVDEEDKPESRFATLVWDRKFVIINEFGVFLSSKKSGQSGQGQNGQNEFRIRSFAHYSNKYINIFITIVRILTSEKRF